MNYTDKIKAFSLIETVIAMMLIMLSIGLSAVLFVKVGSKDQQKNTELLFQLQQVGQQTIQQQQFFDEEISKETYWVERKIKPYEGMEGIYHMQLTAFDLQTNKTIESWSELILVK